MDFTGGHLDLYRKNSDRTYEHCSMPFNLSLKRSDLGPDEIERATAQVAGGQGADQVKLNAFHRLLPLMAGHEEMLNLLWRSFFRSLKENISPVRYKEAVVALIPTAWSPQVAAALVLGFSEVFGITPNCCTTAAAALFYALTEIQTDFNTRPVGHKQTLPETVACQEDTADGEIFIYQLEKIRPDVLNVQLVEWKYQQPLNATVPMVNKAGMLFITAGEAFNTMLDWLDRPDSPRVDLGMDLCIGAINEDGSFLPLRFPDDPACHWFGRGLGQTKCRGGTLALAARPTTAQKAVSADQGALFPMAHVLLNFDKDNPPADPAILLRPLDHSRMEVWVADKGKGRKDLLKTRVRLPRLYN
jgi:hypothetical protein